jgi:beta-lactamase superfamily II metal-dependent hydrolase
MKIKFLKAGGGDAILIHHNNKNILIDGGNDSSYLMKELVTISQNNEYIDLLIITHHDDDHIKGIIDILQQVENGLFGQTKDFIKKVYFNSPRLILKKRVAKEEQFLSYAQAYEVEDLLIKLNIDCQDIITNSSEILELDDLYMTFLSPIESDLEKYSSDPRVLLSCQTRGDWDASMSVLDKHLDDDSQDNSLSNRSSIVILLQNAAKKIMLTGDTTPDRLTKIIDELYINNENCPISFDYIKLPHHGSHRNLNKSILSKIRCQNFIISTNGKNSYLPDKRALLKVLKYIIRKRTDHINFIFNYGEVIDLLDINYNDKKKYNFKLIPNNEIYGYVI